jgi:hypothetical protein
MIKLGGTMTKALLRLNLCFQQKLGSGHVMRPVRESSGSL